jgi:hypothetical protein
MPLKDGTTYYWRVIAYDGASYSEWTTGSFTVNLSNDPPTEPLIRIPQNGAEVQNLEPSLVIYNSTDPNMDSISYYFDIDKVDSFDSYVLQRSPQVQEGVEGMTSWRPTTLSDNTIYYWRVIAYDGASYSEWVYGSFLVNLANDPPETLSVQGPVDGSEVATLSPVLQVNEGIDLDKDTLTYEYEVYSDPNGEHLVTSKTGAGTSWQLDQGLEENRYYWWRCRAIDEEGVSGPWSDFFVFFVNTVNDAPSAPSVNRPQYSREVATLVPVLQVNNAVDVDDDSQSLTYEFEIDKVNTFSSIEKQSGVANQNMPNTASWIPEGLEDNEVYYWRARACDGENCSKWMLTADFLVNTEDEPPSTPNISGPPDGSEVTNSTPTLEVTNATDPENDQLTYEFEVYGDDDMDYLVTWKTGVLDQEDGTTSWQLTRSLHNKRTYWWRVRAKDSENGPSAWSPLSSFKVDWHDDAPSAPDILSPKDGEDMVPLNAILTVYNAEDEDRDPLTYFFELDEVKTFDSEVLQLSEEIPEGNSGNTAWNPDALIDNTLYYWRVRAFDGAAYGDWVMGSFFANAENDPPQTPTIHDPDETSVVTYPMLTLSVYPDTDEDLDILTYDYEVYSAPSPNPGDLVEVVIGASASEEMLEIDSLENHAPYYWRTRAVDEEDEASAWSSMIQFSVNKENARPSAPTLNNPYNRGTVVTLKPVLSVNNSIDMDQDLLTYDFELYADESLTEKIASATLYEGDLITSWRVDTELDDYRTYYWRARAYDGKLKSAWMATSMFVLNTEGVETKVVLYSAEDVAA